MACGQKLNTIIRRSTGGTFPRLRLPSSLNNFMSAIKKLGTKEQVKRDIITARQAYHDLLGVGAINTKTGAWVSARAKKELKNANIGKN